MRRHVPIFNGQRTFKELLQVVANTRAPKAFLMKFPSEPWRMVIENTGLVSVHTSFFFFFYGKQFPAHVKQASRPQCPESRIAGRKRDEIFLAVMVHLFSVLRIISVEESPNSQKTPRRPIKAKQFNKIHSISLCNIWQLIMLML